MTKTNPLKAFFGLMLVFLFSSCEDDEPKVNALPATQFIQDKLTFSENETTSEIILVLNEAPTQDGTITISVTAPNLTGFITTPAIVDGKIQLPVTARKGDVTFSFTPIDNALLNGNQIIDFTIESVSEGLTVGNQKNLSVTIVDNESPALVSFHEELSSTHENSGSPTAVTIALSHASPGAGSIEISVNSDNAIYGTHYITEPAAVNGRVIVAVEPGVNSVSFKVIPINDPLYNGDRSIQYTIAQTEGSVIRGQAIKNTLKITDDELHGKSKGYTIGGGGWGYKREIQYDEEGKISKILFEQTSPGYQLNGFYEYEYDASGKLVKMKETDLTETFYSWEGGRVVKEESFRDGVLKKYVLYGYDATGNVGEASYHYRQSDGELKLSLLIVYLYHEDGNIYKQLNYSPVQGSDDYNLLSTKTFETYSTKENPFTMVDILPTVKTQPNLPLSYRLEEGGHDILFQFTYQFNAAGQPTKRTATSSVGTESVLYEYY
jgi:hypothetical protein